MLKHNALRHFYICLLSLCTLLLAQSSQSAGNLLTAEERVWLTSHPHITLGIWDNYAPISFHDKNGKMQGYMQDYIELLEAKIGYKFKQFIPSAAEDVNKGTHVSHADIVSLLADTPDRRLHWNFAPTLLSFPLDIVASKDADDGLTLSKLNKLKLSVVSGYASQEFVKQKYPEIELDLVSDTCQGLKHVAFRESSAMLTDIPVASWCLKNEGIINLKVAGKSEFDYEMSLAVRNDWPVLFSIIKKGMNAISEEDKLRLEKKWLSQDSFEHNWLEKNRVWLIALALFILLSALIRVYVWDHEMQGNVLQSMVSSTSNQDKDVEHYSFLKQLLPRVLILLLILLVMLAALITTEQWTTTNDRVILGILVGAMLVMMLFGGYKLGGLKRNEENISLFEKLIDEIKTRQIAENVAKEQTARLFKQQKAVQTLTLSEKNNKDAYQEITQVSAEALNVERASIWLIDFDTQQVECLDLYLKSTNTHMIAKSFLLSDWPEYYKSLTSQRVVAASDVMQDAATQEFAKGYVQEKNIGAMLNSSIWMNGKMIGGMSYAHVGDKREWTVDEQNFAQAICDLLRLKMETTKREIAEKALLKYSEELEMMVDARTRSLQESEQRFASVVEYAPIPILGIKMDGEILEFNPEAERVTGYARADAVGKLFTDIFAVKESFRKAIEISAGAQEGQTFRNIELIFKRADGEKIEFECSIVKAGKNADQMIAIGQDITQKKILQDSLIQARESAESADRIKSMFVATMSHELRTPLNSILGFLGVVLQGMSGELNIKQKDQLSRAYHSAKHLLSLISDVIDISKIEAGFLETYVEPFALKPMLVEILNVVNHIAEEKHLAVNIDCGDDILIETDRKRLYQVILNVVSNAVKYTEEGYVMVSVAIISGQLTIKTQDTGIGISTTNLEALFKPFQRFDSHLRIKTLGTGLGLYLTRKILSQLLEGTISAESQVGIGSTFTIQVPIKMSQQVSQSNHSILEEKST